MFDFVSNETLKIILVVGSYLLTTIAGFWGGVKYTKIKYKHLSKYKIGKINKSKIETLHQGDDIYKQNRQN